MPLRLHRAWSLLWLFTLSGVAGTAAAGPLAVTSRFSFHSDPWMNAHHFLYAWATREKSATVPQGHGVPMPDQAVLERLTATERATWEQAVGFYRTRLGAQSLAFSPLLIAVKRRHWDPAAAAAPATDDQQAIEAVVASALPIYERHWWDTHQASHRAWLDAVLPTVRRWEETFTRDLERCYGGRWPAAPVRVDLTAYTDYYGAYNTGEPHVVLATAMAKNAFPQGVELLFHEASHSDSLGNALYTKVARAAEQAAVRLPRDLWHALIFVTTGELTRRFFAAEGRTAYVPYAEKEGLYRPATPWARYKHLLDTHWVPHLDADTPTLDALYAVLVRENARLIVESAAEKK